MTVSTKRRGQPLVVLGALLFAWLCLRATMWTSPFPDADAVEPVTLEAPAGLPVAKVERFQDESTGLRTSRLALPSKTPLGALANLGLTVRTALPADAVEAVQGSGEADRSERPVMDTPLARESRAIRPRPPQPQRSSTRSRTPKRWRLDGWLLVREGSAPAPVAAGNRPASYGASQAGLVARYRLGGSERSPFVYARVNRALIDGGETDFAVGLGLRPLKKVPVIAHGELRLTEVDGRGLLRPTALLTTAIPPLRLPMDLQAEAYGQAGYVGGDFATPFADGQLRIDKKVVDVFDAKLRVGAAVWGGAQKGASRVDVGPSAAVTFDLGKIPARVSLDYRLRVAGNAAPDSGVALTLSSGF